MIKLELVPEIEYPMITPLWWNNILKFDVYIGPIQILFYIMLHKIKYN